MITKETLKTLVEEWLEKGDYFLVDIQMDGGDDRIVIETSAEQQWEGTGTPACDAPGHQLW